ncbi:nitrogen regulatory protein P-II family [Natranaerovirga hydrolytica]|uniref:Nitrogen regulatory protein P-II family n=1 Tax=Natranaerovirga hydrolytica TaxID=680378 RepID=A0A4R1N3G0_9FIRM|nr:P-II family nitrogen regulator [Natranaerovirga hydrolytica]TCL00032.1 nitrogen regulatory protein P-II family [Natranaerovirga hydrolytica]
MENNAITKIDIITRPSQFEELKNELNKIGITGLTVSHVLGCGLQKGKTEYYRGNPYSIDLLPKVKMEIVVSEVPVEEVVRVAKEVLGTGEIGDGKIFIYPIQNVIKVRTGEEGVDAL